MNKNVKRFVNVTIACSNIANAKVEISGTLWILSVYYKERIMNVLVLFHCYKKKKKKKKKNHGEVMLYPKSKIQPFRVVEQGKYHVILHTTVLPTW